MKTVHGHTHADKDIPEKYIELSALDIPQFEEPETEDQRTWYLDYATLQPITEIVLGIVTPILRADILQDITAGHYTQSRPLKQNVDTLYSRANKKIFKNGIPESTVLGHIVRSYYARQQTGKIGRAHV